MTENKEFRGRQFEAPKQHGSSCTLTAQCADGLVCKRTMDGKSKYCGLPV